MRLLSPRSDITPATGILVGAVIGAAMWIGIVYLLTLIAVPTLALMSMVSAAGPGNERPQWHIVCSACA